MFVGATVKVSAFVVLPMYAILDQSVHVVFVAPETPEALPEVCLTSMIERSPLDRAVPVNVEVSAMLPPFAATVFARTPVGTPMIDAVIVSVEERPAVPTEDAESTVTSILTRAAVVAAKTFAADVNPWICDSR